MKQYKNLLNILPLGLQCVFAKRHLLFLLFLMLGYNSFSQFARLKVNINPRYDYKNSWKDYDVYVSLHKHSYGQYNGYLKFAIIKSEPKSYIFDSLEAGIIAIQIDGSDHQPDTIIENVLLSCGKTTEIDVTYPLYCRYIARVNNNICPGCKKKDQVLPIHYGEPFSSDPKSEWSLSHYLGGCKLTGCDPIWFCKRDNLKF